MTSMPASRSARAMTLAPRSCPSSPGLAMTTLKSFASIRSIGDFFVLAPHLAERVAHLADGGIGADGVEDRRHQVAASVAAVVAHPIERAALTRSPSRVRRSFSSFASCVSPARLVDVENLDRRLVLPARSR